MTMSISGTSGVTFPNSTVQATASSYAGTTAQIFTSSGTFTIPSGVTKLKLTVVGGGGGTIPTSNGCCLVGAASGGSGGGMAIKYLTGLTAGNTLTVTVGAAGAAGVGSGNAGNGGTSSVASGTQTITTVQATGGGGTTAAGWATPPAAGTATNGDINLPGQSGQYQNVIVGSSVSGYLMLGGSSPFFGTQSNLMINTGVAGQAGTGYGNGGSCAYARSASFPGYAGSQGIVIIEW